MFPTILERGSELQRERFGVADPAGHPTMVSVIQRTSGKLGPRLAEYRAVKVDDGWLVNGHKIWTSMADRAQFGALLGRTDPHAPKHRGISYFLVDVATPGIEVSPIQQASGRCDFNEVFSTVVFAPDDMLVGNPGEGWELAVSTMAIERTAIGNYVNIDRTVALRRVAAIGGPDQDTALRAIGDVEAHTTAIKAMVLRETLRLMEGQVAGPTSSIAKYAMVMLLRRAGTATLGLTSRISTCHRSSSAGGTAEIQLTVIASMILGLPRK